MAILLRGPIYDVVGMEYTEVATAIAAAGTTLTVDSTEGFNADDYIIIGNLNEEGTEIVKITSVDSSTQLTIGAVTYAHAIDSPVRYTPYNQIKFYRSTSETGTYTNIATETMEVDNENGLTLYNDTEGTTSSWYKFTYYNSNAQVETAISDAEAVKGGYILYCTVEDIYRILHFKADASDKPYEDNILMLIEGRTQQFDAETGSVFVTTDAGSSSDYIYVDGKGQYHDYYYLKRAPIISITALQTTQTTPGSTATWDTLTSGRDNDYILDKDNGYVKIVDSSLIPPLQPSSIRWYGTWGYSSTPDDVRNAVAVGVAIDLASASVYRAMYKGRDGFNPANIDKWQMQWDKTVEKYKRDSIYLV